MSVSDACIDTISENHIVERDFSAKSTVRLMVAFLVPCRQWVDQRCYKAGFSHGLHDLRSASKMRLA